VQRELADNTDSEKEVKFYGMMINIGLDMNTATAALSPYVPGGRNMKVFDVCM
jgi:hypothetical protein